MKLKEVFYGLGLRPPAREYNYDILDYQLPDDGAVQFAQWRHPNALLTPSVPSADEVKGLRRWLKPGDVAIDIGAHSGDSTLPMALAVGPTGLVIAFEPNRYVFRVLVANAGLNRTKTNIHPYQFAAGSADGPMTFEYSDSGFCNGGRHEGIKRWRHAHFFPLEVQARNIPNLLAGLYPAETLNKLRFVKIDTEGFDHVVYKSLLPLITRTKPVIRTEIFRHMPEADRVAYLRDLESAGYRVHRMRSDSDYVGEPITPADAAKWPHFDVLAVPAQ